MVQDLATQWIQSYPCKTKTSQETQRSLQKFLEPNRKPKVIYTDNSLDLAKLVKISPGIIARRHHTDTKQNGIAERAVRRVKEGTSAVSAKRRGHPIRGESQRDVLGESAGSLPQPQDSFPDAGEAMNDFWSMSGSFIYRHHVEPRVKLYSPREESFPIPLKYIDVSRTAHTNLYVKQEKRIDDYWIIDGSRDLSDPWTGFTQFTLLEEKPPDGYMWSGWFNKKPAYIQARSSMARTLEVNGKARQAEGKAEVV